MPGIVIVCWIVLLTQSDFVVHSCQMFSAYTTIIYVYIPELVDILDPSDVVTVNGGQFQVNIQNGMPKVYHPSSDAEEYSDQMQLQKQL